MSRGVVLTSLLLLMFISAAPAADKPQLIGPAEKVDAWRAAPVILGEHGLPVIVGAWVDMTDPLAQGCDEMDTSDLCFDAFEPDDTGFPTGGVECGLPGPGYRWYSGSDYCINFIVKDMIAESAEGLGDRVQVGWFWTVEGPGTAEPMLMAIFNAETYDDTCVGPPADGVFDGVLVQFIPDTDTGGRDCNGNFGSPDGVDDATGSGVDRGYYWTDLCLLDSDLSLQTPEDGEGAYLIQFLTFQGWDNEGNADPNCPDEIFATCAQPMMWGTEDDRPGQHGPIQWDDDNPRDGEFTAPDECYDYTGWAPCPDPVAAMYCYYSFECGCKETGRERIKKAKCSLKKPNKGKLKVKMDRGVFDQPITVCEDLTGQCKETKFNSKGKATAKFKKLPSGDGVVTAEFCRHTDSKPFNCPEP